MLKGLVTREPPSQMKTPLNRRQLLINAGVGAVGTAAVMGTMPAAAFACEHDEVIEGSWHMTVTVVSPIQATLDALFGFAQGGVFTRIDGRDNSAGLGTWSRTEGGEIIFSAILFNFAAGEVPTPATRNGAILAKFAARVVNGALTGTFSAEGILGLSDFSRSGTFTGTRIQAERP